MGGAPSGDEPTAVPSGLKHLTPPTAASPSSLLRLCSCPEGLSILGLFGGFFGFFAFQDGDLINIIICKSLPFLLPYGFCSFGATNKPWTVVSLAARVLPKGQCEDSSRTRQRRVLCHPPSSASCCITVDFIYCCKLMFLHGCFNVGRCFVDYA